LKNENLRDNMANTELALNACRGHRDGYIRREAAEQV
jgi:hypothetical protein